MRLAFLLTVLSLSCAFAQNLPSVHHIQNFDRIVYLHDTGIRDTVPLKYHTLQMGEYWYRQSWSDSIYLTNEFTEGRLEFASGFSPAIRLMMNYNIYLETIDIKDHRGITTMKKFPELRKVIIGERKFIFAPTHGYLEIIHEGRVSVARKTVMAAVAQMSNGTRYRMVGTDTRNEAVNYTRFYWPVEAYYILDPEYGVYRAGIFVLPRMMPQVKDKIRDFALIHKTDYSRKEDVIDIVKFCNENYTGPIYSAHATDVLRMPEDADIRHSAWKDSIYRFTSFEEAYIVLDNGTKEDPAVLNYNHLTGWLETIRKRGDTVTFSTAERIRTVNVDGVTLMNDRVEGLIEVLRHGNVGLGVKKRIVLEGGHNVKVDSLIRPSTVPREKIYYIDRPYYFISQGKALSANARNLMNLFPKRREAIATYLSTYPVDFGLQGDLMDLLAFCLDASAQTTGSAFPIREFLQPQPWRDSVYMFPEFLEGRLEFDTGFSPSTRLLLNYNVHEETIDVLIDSGLFFLTKFPGLKFVWIGDHKFYRHPTLGNLEINVEGPISAATLTRKRSLAEIPVGYVASQSAWAVNRHYILNSDYKLYEASTVSLCVNLKRAKKQIREFARANNIDYGKMEDVVKIVKFCNDLIEERP